MEILEFFGKIFDAIGQSSRKTPTNKPERRTSAPEIRNPFVRFTYKVANLITLQPLRNRKR